MKSKLSERHKERPIHARDFDVNFGLHNLRCTIETPLRREWATPLWHNGVGLGLIVIVILSCLSAWYFNPEARMLPDSVGLILVCLLSGLLLIVILSGLLGLALHRGRLVLDYKTRCLHFYRSLLWPREVWRLSLDDIEALTKRYVDAPGIDDTPSTYGVIVAELRDRRLASIAFDSSPSIIPAIYDVLDPNELKRLDSVNAV